MIASFLLYMISHLAVNTATGALLAYSSGAGDPELFTNEDIRTSGL